MTAALPGIPLEAWRRRGRTLDFKGFPIRYWEAGQGRPLLLIVARREIWRGFAQ